MTETKLPWINPDMTFKDAVAGIGALLTLVLVGLLAVGIVGLFAWYFVMELIHNSTVHALFGLVILLAVVGTIWKAVSDD